VRVDTRTPTFQLRYNFGITRQDIKDVLDHVLIWPKGRLLGKGHFGSSEPDAKPRIVDYGSLVFLRCLQLPRDGNPSRGRIT
jgi:hypothetical protein